jgi:hypothetical protein
MHTALKTSIKHLILLIVLLLTVLKSPAQAGHTEVTEWQGDKNGAVSITYDDGNVNQFKYARAGSHQNTKQTR